MNRALSRVRSDIVSMQAYAIQDARGFVKLDAMENPHRLPPALQAQLGERLGRVAINRYPHEAVAEFQSQLAQSLPLQTGQALMLGNGSDELISLLALACDLPGARILAPVPGFVMYAMSAQLQGLDFVGVPLQADFSLDLPAMLAAIAQHQPAITYLAYPNNPTSNLFAKDDMRAVIAAVAAVGGLVVVDEAYQPFSNHTWLAEMAEQRQANEHVLLLRTLSKFGLAGVRLGYLLGEQALIEQIDKVRPPYNISSLNAECGRFALDNAAVFESQAQVICQERERLLTILRTWPQVTVYDSQANMFLLRMADATHSFAGLKKAGILVKNVSTMHPLLNQCLRVSVGTPAENDQLLAALPAVL